MSFCHDPWCVLGPVWDYLDAGERASLQVRDCFVNLVFSRENDQWRWGAGDFVQSQLWEEVRSKGAAVGWGRWLWSCYGIPKYAFIVLLLLQNRLSTKDRLCRWGMEVDPHCVLCGDLESHDHLFFECPYAAQVWRLILQRLGEYRGAIAWAQERLLVESTMGG
ncbi:hypothetical protein LIER_15420 [Lithospermum erythrorhizon]|uniref:Reverse transcriptase zinc-binding domain-containing protein n=1 Tax=Lithospermum erythrorhizon TaxID=34254 RepID=A0AAV3Q5C5_LITER